MYVYMYTYVSDTVTVFRIYKALLQFDNKKTIKLPKWVKHMKRNFTMESI